MKVGITGGMGSGKTTVCKIFETLGIPVYYADDKAKELMTTNKELKQKIINLFGPEAYKTDQTLNRSFISNVAFHNPPILKKLNQAVHPVVFHDSEIWHHNQKNVPYTIKEAALLFESGGYKLLDKMITVMAPLEIRIKRTIERDKTTRKAILLRIANQLPDEEKIPLSDYVIYNDGKRGLIKQVMAIHFELKKEAFPS